jgi:hypothetical protein
MRSKRDLEDGVLDICPREDSRYEDEVLHCNVDGTDLYDMPERVIADDGDDLVVLRDEGCSMHWEDTDVFAVCGDSSGDTFQVQVGQLPPDGDFDPEFFGMTTSELPWAETVTESRPGPGRGERVTRFR